MKALVYTANEEMTYRDEPAPQPDAEDALIAIESVGICGSDMHAYLGRDRAARDIIGGACCQPILERIARTDHRCGFGRVIDRIAVAG